MLALGAVSEYEGYVVESVPFDSGVLVVGDGERPPGVCPPRTYIIDAEAAVSAVAPAVTRPSPVPQSGNVGLLTLGRRGRLA